MTPRIVIDTNVLVSALIQPKGIPASLIDGVALRGLTLYVSEDVLAEYSEVVGRPKFANINPAKVNRLFAVLAAEAVLVKPASRVAVASHEPDNRFLECAADAAYLITGSNQTLPGALR